MYPLVLRFDVFAGVDLMISTLSAGSETTIVAVQISAVHHKSAMRQLLSHLNSCLTRL
jgi:hypothetical protein